MKSVSIRFVAVVVVGTVVVDIRSWTETEYTCCGVDGLDGSLLVGVWEVEKS